MMRVPFGTTAIPFLLTATLKNHLRSVDGECPVTARILADCLYVDDLLTGAENEEALKIYTEAKAILTLSSRNYMNGLQTARKWVNTSVTVKIPNFWDTSQVFSRCWH